MPQVSIQVIGEPPSDTQRAAAFAEITDLMVDVLGRTRKLVVVSISSSPAADWAVGGEAAKKDRLVGIQAVIRIIAGANSDEQKSEMIARTTAALKQDSVIRFTRFTSRSTKYRLRRGATTARPWQKSRLRKRPDEKAKSRFGVMSR